MQTAGKKAAIIEDLKILSDQGGPSLNNRLVEFTLIILYFCYSIDSIILLLLKAIYYMGKVNGGCGYWYWAAYFLLLLVSFLLYGTFLLLEIRLIVSCLFFKS